MKGSAFISQGKDGLSRPTGLWAFPDLRCMLSAPAAETAGVPCEGVLSRSYMLYH